MGNEQELRRARHFLDHAAETLGIRVVERRIDLVEQAERRRVQLEHREDQRDRGQRLLATGKQVDRRVLLARRLRDDLHAGIEDFLAGHHQLGPAATEQFREKLPEMAVDRVEGRLQQFARFAVDAADRAFQRFHRLGQVGRLLVEVALALGRRFQFLQRRQVDRAELGDRVGQPGDLALQRRRPRRAARTVEFRLQRSLVGAGLEQLQRKLLSVQGRRLLLQLQFADPGAQRLQPLLDLQALLVERAQGMGRRLQRIAPHREHPFAFGAGGQRVLQLAFHDVRRCRLDLLSALGAIPLDAGQFALRRGLLREDVLQLALRLA